MNAPVVVGMPTLFTIAAYQQWQSIVVNKVKKISNFKPFQ
jgi:hypothetical protein